MYMSVLSTCTMCMRKRTWDALELELQTTVRLSPALNFPSPPSHTVADVSLSHLILCRSPLCKHSIPPPEESLSISKLFTSPFPLGLMCLLLPSSFWSSTSSDGLQSQALPPSPPCLLPASLYPRFTYPPIFLTWYKSHWASASIRLLFCPFGLVLGSQRIPHPPSSLLQHNFVSNVFLLLGLCS